MWSAIVMVPVRQLIRIGVTVIEEFTLLTDNAARVLIGLPLVDTRGVVAQQLLVYFHRGVDVRALRNRIHTLIVDPTVAKNDKKQSSGGMRGVRELNDETI